MRKIKARKVIKSIRKTEISMRKYLEIIAYEVRSKNRSRYEQGDKNYGLQTQNDKIHFLIFSYRNSTFSYRNSTFSYRIASSDF